MLTIVNQTASTLIISGATLAPTERLVVNALTSHMKKAVQSGLLGVFPYVAGQGLEVPDAPAEAPAVFTVNGVPPNAVGDVDTFVPVRSRRKSTRSLSDYVEPTSTAAYLDRTYRLAVAAPADFVAVRVVMRNMASTDLAATGKIYVAASTNHTDDNPTGPWNLVTFNGRDPSGSFKLPAAYGAFTRNSAVPTDVTSDWIQLSSIPRASGQPFPILYVSGYIPAANGSVTLMSNTSQPPTQWADTNDPVTQGRVFRAWSAVGDQANSTSITPVADGYGCPFAELEFLHTSDVITICAIGDSIANGDAGPTRMVSPVHFASTALSTAIGLPVSAENRGFSSQNTCSFVGRLARRLEGRTLPDVIVYSAYSPNDFGTGWPMALAIAQMKDNLERAIVLCRQKSVNMIVATGLPQSLAVVKDVYRVEFNAYVKDVCAKYGLYVVDYDAVLKDPADNAQMQAAYRTDSIHPNTAGYKLMGAELAKVIASTL